MPDMADPEEAAVDVTSRRSGCTLRRTCGESISAVAAAAMDKPMAIPDMMAASRVERDRRRARGKE